MKKTQENTSASGNVQRHRGLANQQQPAPQKKSMPITGIVGKAPTGGGQATQPRQAAGPRAKVTGSNSKPTKQSSSASRPTQKKESTEGQTNADISDALKQGATGSKMIGSFQTGVLHKQGSAQRLKKVNSNTVPDRKSEQKTAAIKTRLESQAAIKIQRAYRIVEKNRLMKMAAEAISVSEQMLGRDKSDINLQNFDQHYDVRASLDTANRVVWDGKRQENFSVFARNSPPQSHK